jgi:isocitrate dehydrogenase
VAYHPFVRTNHPLMDLVIVRENEEDLYAGIEHRQTLETYQCLKLITRAGCEKIIRYAFEYAVQHNRKKVSCFTKDNIMKMTDGLFHKVFNEVGKEYPQIEQEHYIIDIGTARLATHPERFDVIVTLNLYGDIISDVAAEICGSVGLAGSANIGESFAMFEAIHGSAPDIAGKGIANPSGLLQGAVQMLVHIGQTQPALLIQNAWLKTIEDGIHTGDIYIEGQSKERLGTQAFADAVIARLGQKPGILREAEFSHDAHPIHVHVTTPPMETKELIGIDIFLDQRDGHPNILGPRVEKLGTDKLKLRLITNRGIKVYPAGQGEVSCADHWRCRFNTSGSSLTYADIVELFNNFVREGLEPIKTENLYLFNGERGYSLAQGE